MMGAELLLVLGSRPVPLLPPLPPPGGEAKGALRMSGGGFSCWGFGSEPADAMATGATPIGPMAAWVAPTGLALLEDCSLGTPTDLKYSAFVLYKDDNGGSGLSPLTFADSPAERGREPSRTEVSLTKLGWSVPMGVARPELGGLWTGVLLGVGSSIVGEVREERGVNMVGGISVGDASDLVAWRSPVCVCVRVCKEYIISSSLLLLQSNMLNRVIIFYLSLPSWLHQVPLHSDA